MAVHCQIHNFFRYIVPYNGTRNGPVEKYMNHVAYTDRAYNDRLAFEREHLVRYIRLVAMDTDRIVPVAHALHLCWISILDHATYIQRMFCLESKRPHHFEFHDRLEVPDCMWHLQSWFSFDRWLYLSFRRDTKIQLYAIDCQVNWLECALRGVPVDMVWSAIQWRHPIVR